MKTNKELLVLTHLSQLLDFVTVFGGSILPLCIWIFEKNEVEGMDKHGKAILNFRISMFVYCLLCIPMVLLLGIGLLGFLIIGFFVALYPIINAIRVSNDKEPYYPFTIEFIK